MGIIGQIIDPNNDWSLSERTGSAARAITYVGASIMTGSTDRQAARPRANSKRSAG